MESATDGQKEGGCQVVVQIKQRKKRGLKKENMDTHGIRGSLIRLGQKKTKSKQDKYRHFTQLGMVRR